MALDKQQVLAGAPAALNGEDKPWEVAVAGDSIVARWKWMDARFFGPGSVSDEQRDFTFTVTLKDNGKWKESDTSASRTTNVSMNGGKIGFGTSASSFKGHSTQKSVSFGIGQDKRDGSMGVVRSSLDTGLVKDAVRSYLSQCGWKKAGLFG
ncbi:hypothetical protein [Propionimicrobium sp. PCR01-08-3]|uniref:hypothetical protein n=1 Tax=Propionimicrobium sp. PCR01-08-3 TaxID=3052086 RepID=UPI00255C3AF2|nr:hypothetical protein [Propionimicrobium sp. PCR01-08-3]WIY83396.1 hypothetical protein QQ658_03285 [Propionimicrobium sp. PCR01-08-3]